MQDSAQRAGAWDHRWRQVLAAGLLLLTGCIFWAVALFSGSSLPGWLWLILVALGALALVAQPQSSAVTTTAEPAVAGRPVPGPAVAETPPPQVILAAVTHELRTPLNAIIGFSELLRDAETSGASGRQRQDFANAILDNAQNLQLRLNDVLDANRIASAALRISEQSCDLAEIIETVIRERQDAATARAVTIVARIAEGIDCRGDVYRLRQAFAAILDNAIAFSPAEGIVNINMLRGPAGELVTTVTDAGPGIAGTDIARAFEPFRQLDEGAARHHAGLGLGLFIARGLLSLHGGDVTLTSSAETGTEVRLTLPASRVTWPAVLPALVQVSRKEKPSVAVAHVA